MEIDITGFFKSAETWKFSGSIATHGPDAGPRTWNAAKQEASREPLLKTEAEMNAMRHWAYDTGAWEREEIAAWSAEDVNALFIQLISGDMRETGLDAIDFDDAEAWAKYEKWCENQSGSLYKNGERVYYDLSP